MRFLPILISVAIAAPLPQYYVDSDVSESESLSIDGLVLNSDSSVGVNASVASQNQDTSDDSSSEEESDDENNSLVRAAINEVEEVMTRPQESGYHGGEDSLEDDSSSEDEISDDEGSESEEENAKRQWGYYILNGGKRQRTGVDSDGDRKPSTKDEVKEEGQIDSSEFSDSSDTSTSPSSRVREVVKGKLNSKRAVEGKSDSETDSDYASEDMMTNNDPVKKEDEVSDAGEDAVEDKDTRYVFIDLIVSRNENGYDGYDTEETFRSPAAPPVLRKGVNGKQIRVDPVADPESQAPRETLSRVSSRPYILTENLRVTITDIWIEWTMGLYCPCPLNNVTTAVRNSMLDDPKDRVVYRTREAIGRALERMHEEHPDIPIARLIEDLEERMHQHNPSTIRHLALNLACADLANTFSPSATGLSCYWTLRPKYEIAAPVTRPGDETEPVISIEWDAAHAAREAQTANPSVLAPSSSEVWGILVDTFFPTGAERESSVDYDMNDEFSGMSGEEAGEREEEDGKNGEKKEKEDEKKEDEKGEDGKKGEEGGTKGEK